MVVQWLERLPNNKKVLGSNPDLAVVPFCVEFFVLSMCTVCMGFHWVRRLPPTVQKNVF